ncbi:XdhC family protein [Brucellaceae bacterium C25G]
MKQSEIISSAHTQLPVSAATINENDFPFMPAISAETCALAVIVGVEGPSYRRCGAAMVIDASGRSWGNLSSGCIDKNVILKAKTAMETGETIRVRFGKGSPYWDVPLPCGGAIDIQIFPFPDRNLLNDVAQNLKARRPAMLTLQTDGRLMPYPTGLGLHLTILPQVRLLVFGTGLETICFAELALAAGCKVEVFSPDVDVLTRLSWASPLVTNIWPSETTIDERSAVITFFHDHDREPSILGTALASPAFFIGSQGSRRAHMARCDALTASGCSDENLAKLTFPLGLIPSTRDPQTLAVSVLAHVLKQEP